LHLTQREKGYAQNQHERQRLQQNIHQHIRLILRLPRIFHPVILQQRQQGRVIGDRHGAESLAILGMASDPRFADLHIANAALRHLGTEIGIANNRPRRIAARAEHGDDQHQRQKYTSPDKEVLEPRVRIGLIFVHAG